jgi:hypothetical protein
MPIKTHITFLCLSISHRWYSYLSAMEETRPKPKSESGYDMILFEIYISSITYL